MTLFFQTDLRGRFYNSYFSLDDWPLTGPGQNSSYFERHSRETQNQRYNIKASSLESLFANYPTKSDSNKPAPLQTVVRILKFCIEL